MVEEECWWDWKSRKLDVKSRNLSASDWVTLLENSSYSPHSQNSNWYESFVLLGSVQYNLFSLFET